MPVTPIWHLEFGDCARPFDSLLNLGFLSLCEFLATSKMAVSLYLLYSPDLAVCDLFLFQKHMMSLKGRRFNVITDFKKSWGILAKIQKYYLQNASNDGAFTGLAI